ncbi:MAG TPA: cupin domain-containing protein, partial [Acidimicrobiales bacterium]|nr:cupin domain-containing protein [Acidimicrobiales bacterium]
MDVGVSDLAAPPPPFPGGIGLSHLRVYDTTAPDGLAGGTPHLHTVCTEAYAVVAGRGRVQTLTASGFAEQRLEPGAFVWFTPGTIHRLVNEGDLEILVLMANAGLPEAGDMVITFAPEVVADPAAYATAATLPDDDRTRRPRRRHAPPPHRVHRGLRGGGGDGGGADADRVRLRGGAARAGRLRVVHPRH